MDKKLYKLMNWPKIEAIIYSEEDNPHELLGPHSINYIVKNPVASNTCVQAFYPDAVAMDLILPETGAEHSMQMVDEAGYYAVLLSIIIHFFHLWVGKCNPYFVYLICFKKMVNSINSCTYKGYVCQSQLFR